MTSKPDPVAAELIDRANAVLGRTIAVLDPMVERVESARTDHRPAVMRQMLAVVPSSVIALHDPARRWNERYDRWQRKRHANPKRHRRTTAGDLAIIERAAPIIDKLATTLAPAATDDHKTPVGSCPALLADAGPDLVRLVDQAWAWQAHWSTWSHHGTNLRTPLDHR
ncbi:hypothetical protein GCM10009804_58250 [Kribbella hippodromi]|uniref:DUF4254 domain-containing protein n=1 Tax=Kribbella hippodromi TaxID=434347 RepID=A0ABP4PXB4_9ACTN